MTERTITISGYSKTFSITGWRIGYTVSSAKWAQMIGYLNDLIYVCAPAPLQMGVAKGILELGPEYYQELAFLYGKKRYKICSTLSEIGLTPSIPQGAYYVLADVTHLPGSEALLPETFPVVLPRREDRIVSGTGLCNWGIN